jgi:hypothetical protein
MHRVGLSLRRKAGKHWRARESWALLSACVRASKENPVDGGIREHRSKKRGLESASEGSSSSLKSQSGRRGWPS